MTEAEEIQAENEKYRKELASAYKRLFKTNDGKIILKDLTSFCGFLKTSTNVEFNPYYVMFAEGKRRVYLRIHSMITKENKNG